MQNKNIVEEEETVTFVRTELEKLRVGETFRSSLSYERDLVTLCDFEQVVHRFEGQLLAEKLAEDVYEAHAVSEWPKSTWQMFKFSNKHRWWMRRFVKKHPVEMYKDRHTLHVGVKRYLAYPEASVTIRNPLNPFLGRPFPRELVDYSTKTTSNRPKDI